MNIRKTEDKNGKIDKSLKKMSRTELLELLVEQSEQIEKLEKDLKIAMVLLKKRQIELKQSGNIAEAALKLNGVFEAAQKAADEYVENVRRKADAGEFE
jgi:hypothetical protein